MGRPRIAAGRAPGSTRWSPDPFQKLHVFNSVVSRPLPEASRFQLGGLPTPSRSFTFSTRWSPDPFQKASAVNSVATEPFQKGFSSQLGLPPEPFQKASAANSVATRTLPEAPRSPLGCPPTPSRSITIITRLRSGRFPKHRDHHSVASGPLPEASRSRLGAARRESRSRPGRPRAPPPGPGTGRTEPPERCSDCFADAALISCRP